MKNISVKDANGNTIKDTAGEDLLFTGQDSGITMGAIIVSNVANISDGDLTNSVANLYGTGITAKSISNASLDHINFFLSDSEDTVLTLTDKVYRGAYLDDETLTFTMLESLDALHDFTLIESQKMEIHLSDEQLKKDWAITDASGATVATGKLALYNDNKTLKMTFPVPEPATATLSLLALAGLAARRRRR